MSLRWRMPAPWHAGACCREAGPRLGCLALPAVHRQHRGNETQAELYASAARVDCIRVSQSLQQSAGIDMHEAHAHLTDSVKDAAHRGAEVAALVGALAVMLRQLPCRRTPAGRSAPWVSLCQTAARVTALFPSTVRQASRSFLGTRRRASHRVAAMAAILATPDVRPQRSAVGAVAVAVWPAVLLVAAAALRCCACRQCVGLLAVAAAAGAILAATSVTPAHRPVQGAQQPVLL